MDFLQYATITEIAEIAEISSHKGRYLEIIDREYYGLSFCKEGKITYRHKGKTFVSDKYTAVLLPKGESYTLYGNESGIFPIINFYAENLDLDTFKTVKLLNPEGYLKSMEKLHDMYLFKKNRAKILSIFYDLISNLSLENAEKEDVLSPAVRFIEQNYFDGNLSNTVLAEKANISEVYFRRLFKEKYGITPKQYILDIRIRRAKQLLDLKNSVSFVAQECGFGSVYHFCRIFKEKTGLTPTQYTNA